MGTRKGGIPLTLPGTGKIRGLFTFPLSPAFIFFLRQNLDQENIDDLSFKSAGGGVF